MKRLFALLLAMVLVLLSITGCAGFQQTGHSAPEPTWEELEAYKVLSAGIDDNATLAEMLDAFKEMCQVPMKTTCDIFVYNVYTYEYEGTKYLHFMVSRQFEIPTYYEILDCGFSATYILDEDIADLQESIHEEMSWEEFIQAVKESEAYNKLLDKPIHKRTVGIDSW